MSLSPFLLKCFISQIQVTATSLDMFEKLGSILQVDKDGKKVLDENAN